MINEITAAELCHELTALTQRGAPIRREPIRTWALSAVERLHLRGGRTVVFKYAAEPFTPEDHALRHAETQDVPVPKLYASTVRDGVLGMLLQDLGTPDRAAKDTDAAEAAAQLHAAEPIPNGPTLGRNELRNLPSAARAALSKLQAEDRYLNAGRILRAGSASTPPPGTSNKPPATATIPPPTPHLSRSSRASSPARSDC